jgi:hypothetical protein
MAAPQRAPPPPARREIAVFLWLPALSSPTSSAFGGSGGGSGCCPCTAGPAGLLRLTPPRLRECLRVLEREGIVAGAAMTPWCRCGPAAGRRSRGGSSGAGAGSNSGSSAAAVYGCFARLALTLDAPSLTRLGNVATIHNELSILAEFWCPASVGADAPASGGGLQQWLAQFVGYLAAARGLALLRPQQRTILRGFTALTPLQQALLATLVYRRICIAASQYSSARPDDPGFVWACPDGGTGEAAAEASSSSPGTSLDSLLAIDAADFAAAALLQPLVEAGWLSGPRSGGDAGGLFTGVGGDGGGPGGGGSDTSPSGAGPCLYASWAGGRTLLLAGVRRLALADGFWRTALDVAGLVLGTSAEPYILERRFRLGALWACGLAILPAPWAPARGASDDGSGAQRSASASTSSAAAAPPPPPPPHSTHASGCPRTAHVAPSWFGITAVAAQGAPGSSATHTSSLPRLATPPTGLVPFVLFPHRTAYAQCRDARAWAKRVEAVASDVGGGGLSLFMLGASGSGSTGGAGSAGGAGPTHTLRRLVSQVLYRPAAGATSKPLPPPPSTSSSSSAAATSVAAAGNSGGWYSALTYSGPSIYRWARAASDAPPLRLLGVHVAATAANLAEVIVASNVGAALPGPARALLAALAPDAAGGGGDARWWEFPEAGPPPLPPAGALSGTAVAGGVYDAQRRMAAALAAAADGRVFTAPFGFPPERYIPLPTSAVSAAAGAAPYAGPALVEPSEFDDGGAQPPSLAPTPPVSVSRPVYASSWAQREANPVAHYARGILSAADAYLAHGRALLRSSSSGNVPRVYITQAALEGVSVAAAVAGSGGGASPAAPYAPQSGEGDTDGNPGAALLEASRLAYFLLQLHTGAVSLDVAARASYVTSPAGGTGASGAVVVLGDDDDAAGDGVGAGRGNGSSAAAASSTAPSSTAAAPTGAAGSRHARRSPDGVVPCDGAGVFHREHTYYLLQEACRASQAFLLGARILHRALHADPLFEWSSYRGARESNKWNAAYADLMAAARTQAQRAALAVGGPAVPRKPASPPQSHGNDGDGGGVGGKKHRRAETTAADAIAEVQFAADGDSDDDDALFRFNVGDDDGDDDCDAMADAALAPHSTGRGGGRRGGKGAASLRGRGGAKGSAAAASAATLSSSSSSAAPATAVGDGSGVFSPERPAAAVSGSFRQISLRLLPWPRTQIPPSVADAVSTAAVVQKVSRGGGRGAGAGDDGGGSSSSSSKAAAAASTATALFVSADFSVLGNRDEVEQFHSLERPLGDEADVAAAAMGAAYGSGGSGSSAEDADAARMDLHLRALAGDGRGWAELCPSAAPSGAASSRASGAHAGTAVVVDSDDSDGDVVIIDGDDDAGGAVAAASSSAPPAPLPRLTFGLPRPILRPGKLRRSFVGADGEPWWVEHAVLQAFTMAHDPLAALAASPEVGFTGDTETGNCSVDKRPRNGAVASSGGGPPLRFPLRWDEAAAAARVRASAGFRLIGDPNRLTRLLYLRQGALADVSGAPPLISGIGALSSSAVPAGWETAVLRRGHSALAGAYVIRGLCPPRPVTHAVDRAVVGWTTPRLVLVPAAGGGGGSSSSSSQAPALPQRLGWAHGLNGWRGTHGENVLWEALFALLFWDVLYATPASLAAQLRSDANFGGGAAGSDGNGDGSGASSSQRPPRLPLPAADVPAALDHVRWCLKTPWDSEPRDYNDADWTAPGGARRALVDARLAALTAMAPCQLAAEVAAAYAAHAGAAAMDYKLRWESFSLGDLTELAHAAGPVPLGAVCGHLATNLYAFLGGLPDVALWRPHPCPHCPYGLSAEAESATVAARVSGSAVPWPAPAGPPLSSSSSSAVATAGKEDSGGSFPVLVHFHAASPPPSSSLALLPPSSQQEYGGGGSGVGGGRYDFPLPPELARYAKGGKKAAAPASQPSYSTSAATAQSYGGWSYWRYDDGAGSAGPGMPPAAARRGRWRFTAAALKQLYIETAAKRAVAMTSSAGRGGGGTRRDDGVALRCAGAHAS